MTRIFRLLLFSLPRVSYLIEISTLAVEFNKGYAVRWT
jgi:hypothetical protein